MKKEKILKAIMELPKVETNNPISTMYGINVDDLMSAIDRLNKVPTYDELLRENKKQKEINRKAVNYVRESSKKYCRDWGQDDCSTEIYLDEDEVFKLLGILEDKEV